VEEELYLAILVCPIHRFNAIALEQKSCGGYRLTGSKCCGSWETVQRWKVSPKELIDTVKQETRRAKQIKRAEEREKAKAKPRKKSGKRL
jgi:hypothetical protein